LGFPECPWCQQLAPIVDEAARAEGIEKVYYLNIRDARTNNDATYQKLVEKLQSYLPKDEDGNPRIFVPDVTAVRQGKIVGRFEQEEAADGEEVKPDTFWTTDRRKRAVIQFREMMRQTQQFATVQHDIKNGAMLLDVRTSAEFASGHFANAANLDVEDISKGKLPDAPKDTKIYVYCRSGNRSSQAATMLKAAGFTNVTDLGGLSAVEKIGGKLVQ
jgi:rhodanese-related sulfurtransferase